MYFGRHAKIFLKLLDFQREELSEIEEPSFKEVRFRKPVVVVGIIITENSFEFLFFTNSFINTMKCRFCDIRFFLNFYKEYMICFEGAVFFKAKSQAGFMTENHLPFFFSFTMLPVRIRSVSGGNK